jgi:ADP-ribosylglycohydrolase
MKNAVLAPDYAERVYAGVLGKIIGVYLGRPFEGWTYDRIMAELGEIHYYVHEQRGVPLVVTDDDISGTFTFLRALPDYDHALDLTPAQIGQTWLNYLIEKRTVLWWGGLGNSTEHTAYQRLKCGIPAPQSGSMALNGPVVAEQIGAQIFIDGWGMIAAGDPELAADLARRASSVSHDGNAIYGAQVIAAIEAAAFVESDLDTLINTALRFIPHDSTIYRLIGDVREWHAAHGNDWRKTREQIAAHYGYDQYGGNCHIVPNHALVIMSLLHGDDDFQKSLMIVNTSGWDTDCNSGNVGCILGIKNGLAGIEAGPDWRGPVADRMYLPTADGGRAISDAVIETVYVVNIARVLAGADPLAPKGGARYHFELPGSVQGFRADTSAQGRAVLSLENVTGHSPSGEHSLALHYRKLAAGRVARASTATFIPPEDLDLGGYRLIASPTLYKGQTVQAAVIADGDNRDPVTCALYISAYGADDALYRVYSPDVTLAPGASHSFIWTIDSTASDPVAEIGVELRSDRPVNGSVYLDRLTWGGTPEVALTRPAHNGTVWRRAWADGVENSERWWAEPMRLIQNEGRGLMIHGTRDWSDYRVQAAVTPHLARHAGIAARVQGMRRYYALLLGDDDKLRLIKALDGEIVLAEADCAWPRYVLHDLALEVVGHRIKGWLGDQQIVLEAEDTDRPLTGGAVALIIEEGTLGVMAVSVEPPDLSHVQR